jgi:hypothetical protein
MLTIGEIFVYDVPEDARGKKYLIAHISNGLILYSAATDDKETAFKLARVGKNRIFIQRWRTI